jgi:hypothetical protein
MMRRKIGFVFFAIVGIVLIFNGLKSGSSQKELKSEGRPADYSNLINRTSPGDNWKSIEAASMRDLIESRRMKSGSDSLDRYWSERGPANIPGRITDIKIDYRLGLIYCLSDHGLVFKGNLDGTGWKSLNDQHPLAQDVGCYLDIIQMADHTRILVGGWQKTLDGWGVFYSDDDGATWQKPAGLFQYPVSGIRRGKAAGDAIYLFVQEYYARQSTDYYTIYKSADQGTSFQVLYRSKIRTGEGNRNTKSDMWISGLASSNDIYLALEDSLFVVSKQDGSRVFKTRISGISSENGLLLTGASNSNPARLRAWVGDAGIARFYASNDGGSTWTHKGDFTDGVAAYPFGYNSFSASSFTADTLYFGGILAIRSTDAGSGWTLIDMDPTKSYALYHGDVPKTMMTVNPDGVSEVYFGTDGGLYKRDSGHDHLVNISIPGLNSTQIYKMSSKHNEPGKMFVGTQDNGYLKTLTGFDGRTAADFKMIWGGDVTNVASGDNGRTFWVWWWGEGCNYVTKPEEDFTISNFSPSWINKECPYWEAPIWVPVQNPDQCFTSGRPKGSSGSYLIRIQAQKNATATAIQYPFNFKASAGDLVTAIAVSPIDSSNWYVATANGYFFRSTDAGKTWSSKKLLAASLYARAIYPSRLVLGKIWIGGSGYSNPAVYYSSDNGNTFKGLSIGLPKTIVEAFDANPDESLLFAATGVAPMMLRTENNSWNDIAGSAAPLVHYMDVEYIAEINTARFATYARGIWDFTVPKSLDIQIDIVNQSEIRIYPLPAHDQITVEIGQVISQPAELRLYTLNGKLLLSQKVTSNLQTLNTADLPRGAYLVNINFNGQSESRRIILE